MVGAPPTSQRGEEWDACHLDTRAVTRAPGYRGRVSSRLVVAALVGCLGLGAVVGSPPAVDGSNPVGAAVESAAQWEAVQLDAAEVLAVATGPPEPSVEAEVSVRTAALAQEVDRLGADVSVALKDVETGQELLVGDTVVEAASTIKLDIVAALMLREDGDLDRRERRLVRSMIRVSDNPATDTVFSDLGADAVNRFAQDAGEQDTLVEGDEWGSTSTTALDRLRVLRALLGKESLLRPEDQRRLRQHMTNVTPEQRIGVHVASDRPGATPLKAGATTSEDEKSWYVSSMGEVTAGGLDYLVAVVSAGNRTLEGGAERIESAARLVVTEAARLAEGRGD